MPMLSILDSRILLFRILCALPWSAARTKMNTISKGLLSLALFSGAIAANAQTYTLLYTYPQTDSGDTGITYQSVMSQGRDGNLYGTIETNGTYTYGTVYKMTTAGVYSAIYNFCAEGAPCASTGGDPEGGVVLGFDGNLWGTTLNGGKDAAGTVFNVTPEGVLKLVYSFTNGNDDSAPTFSVLQGQDGNMYGVSEAQYETQYGSFFKLTTRGVMTPHPFDYTNGAAPNLPVLGTDGNYYGTTELGGDPSCRCGTIYKATAAGKITVLHTFTGFDGVPYDGERPLGTLVEGSDGNFYGTTYEGGDNGTDNGGVVFKITPEGVYSIIHDFVTVAPNYDGQLPYSGLILGTDGDLYGTTAKGGSLGGGTIYQITTSGAEKVLYNFCTGSCYDGLLPTTAMVQHTDGKFYGSSSGNSLGGSVFYSLDMGLSPFVKLETWSAEVGATAQILGQGFTEATKVSFNGGIAAKVDGAAIGTFMTVTVPAGALSGPVTVTTATGTLTSDRNFLVKPQLGSVTPTSGIVGATVTIAGVSLTQTTGVTIGGKAATFTVISDTEVTAEVPAGARTGDSITLATPGGTADSTTKFVVEPEVTSFSPKSGPVAASVTITGHSFTGATAVTFGGVAATFTVISDSKLDTQVPTGAVTGLISVTTPGGVGTSKTKFTVN
jgi:uncharacterized repeat protein (TIGR03803 family)